MNLIISGRYIDIFLCQYMRNNKNKHSGGVSCSACNSIYIYRKTIEIINNTLKIEEKDLICPQKTSQRPPKSILETKVFFFASPQILGIPDFRLISCHYQSWSHSCRVKLRSSNEPPHDKNKKMPYAPSEDRSVWVSAQSNQSLCCLHEESLGP